MTLKLFLLHRESQKIKVRILHNTVAFWNSIKTVASNFKADDRYDVLIILCVPADKDEKRQMFDEGYQFVFWDKYDVQQDKPDILVVSNLFDNRTLIPNCREYTKFVVAVPMSLIRYTHTSRWDLEKVGLRRYRSDYYLVDSLLYQEIKETAPSPDRILEILYVYIDHLSESYSVENLGVKKIWLT